MQWRTWTALGLVTLLAGCPEPEVGDPDGGADAGELPLPVVRTLLDGEVLLGARGLSAPIEFEVPEDTVALTVTVVGLASANYYVSSWSDAGGVLVTDNWLTSAAGYTGICLNCPVRVTLMDGAGGAIAPNNPAAEVRPGPHSITVGGVRIAGNQLLPSTGMVKVTVHAKVLPDVPQTGILDLNVHFTGAATGNRGWTSETAPTSASFQRVLDGVRSIYGQVGIELGEVRYYDIDPKFRVIESMTGEDSDLMQMFATSASHPEANAVNLFFVESLETNGGVLLGIAGGIPGPVLEQGSWRSGVAVIARPPHGTGSSVEEVVAHEIGHFLGLFHTSEYQIYRGIPQVHDPLPDTPRNDPSYLMHASGSGRKLSPWQGRVMRLNPFVRNEEMH